MKSRSMYIDIYTPVHVYLHKHKKEDQYIPESNKYTEVLQTLQEFSDFIP